MEGNFSGETRKSYPIRSRISRDDAVNNILNWLQDEEEEEVLYTESESEEEFSEAEEVEPSDLQLLDYDDENSIPLAITQTEAGEDGSSNVDNVDEVDDNVFLQDLVVGDQRKRGRPPATKAKKSGLAQQHDNVDEWEEVVGDDDMRTHEFRFIPAKQPGVHAELDGTSTVFQCFIELFDMEVQEQLVTLINEFATYKLQQNNPATKRSRYTKWYPITTYELYKMFAVLIAMGIDHRPNLSDYWSMDTFNYSPWYHELFPRDRFESIYSTMLHAGSVGDEQSKKDKIETLLEYASR